MRAIAALAPLLVACTATIPEGRLQCADATECPPGWSCAGGLCYSQPRDAGTGPIDAAGDGGRDAGSEPVDGGGDAGPGDAGALDAGTPDGGPPEELVGVALGDAHSCAVTSAGRVFCWGANAQGQLGDGSSARRTTAVAIEPGAMPPVSALCAGASHTCALAGDEVWCWGSNARGQVGHVDMGASYHRPAQIVESDASAIACGSAFTCAIVGGAVTCWGENIAGQLGEPPGPDRMRPAVASMAPADAVALTAGANYTCALVASGAAFCWGHNSAGQLGDADTPAGWLQSTATPVRVDWAEPFVALEAGAQHTCGVDAMDRVLCWGLNASRQLGAPGADRLAPTEAVALPSVASAVAAGGAHTCAIGAGLAPTCWGQNNRGQVGNAAFMPFVGAEPTAVSFLFSGVRALDAGIEHTCAVEAGRALCWGSNNQGQLGNATTTDSNVPVPVMGIALSTP